MMKKVMIVTSVIFSAITVIAEKQSIDRYQSVIDRQMFGPLPVNFDRTKMPSEVAKSSANDGKVLTKEQEQLQSSVHFSVINITPEGETAVGFSDNSVQPPKHYYLRVGEVCDGWSVKEANAAEATMTIAKGDIEVSLTIGDNSGAGGGKTSKSETASNVSPPAPTARGGRLLNSASLRTRRMRREESMAAELERREAERKEREAKEAAEKEERAAERDEILQQLKTIQETQKLIREGNTNGGKSEPEGSDENNDNR